MALSKRQFIWLENSEEKSKFGGTWRNIGENGRIRRKMKENEGISQNFAKNEGIPRNFAQNGRIRRKMGENGRILSFPSNIQILYVNSCKWGWGLTAMTMNGLA